jgi:hypothetical protein
MKQNVLTVFHFFKALMEKVKQSRPRSYGQWRMIPQKILVSQKKVQAVVNSLLSTASEESVKEIQRNVRIASAVRKPSPTYESLSDVAEAKVTRGRSTKTQLANPGAKERELSHKPEQSDCEYASCPVWKNDRTIIHQFIFGNSSASIV